MNNNYGREERGSKLKLATSIAENLQTTYENQENVLFEVEASGLDLKYQWSVFNTTWEDIDGATKAKLSLREITEDMDGLEFRCKVYNSKGSVYSDTVKLTVNQPTVPEITSNPTDVEMFPKKAYASTDRYASYVTKTNQ